MRLTRSRATAAALAVSCAAAVGGGAVIAQGQAPVPPGPPTGTLEFEVTVRSGDFGVNRAFARARGPHIGDVLALNGRITGPGALRGTVDAAQVITDQGNGRPNARGVRFGSRAYFDFGNGDTLIADAIISPDESDRTGRVEEAIVGGTGRFAGARGVGAQTRISDTRRESRSRFTFTFMP
jgi:hypothetical protein